MAIRYWNKDVNKDNHYVLEIVTFLFELSLFCSMADRISFDVSLSLNCIDLYKRGGEA